MGGGWKGITGYSVSLPLLLVFSHAGFIVWSSSGEALSVSACTAITTSGLVSKRWAIEPPYNSELNTTAWQRRRCR